MEASIRKIENILERKMSSVQSFKFKELKSLGIDEEAADLYATEYAKGAIWAFAKVIDRNLDVDSFSEDFYKNYHSSSDKEKKSVWENGFGDAMRILDPFEYLLNQETQAEHGCSFKDLLFG